MSGSAARARPEGRDGPLGPGFICATHDPPALVRLRPPASPRPLPAAAVVGLPSFPRAAADGTLAYVTLTGESVSSAWLTALALVSPAGGLIDLVPGAALFCPPAWSEDGSRLLFARDHPGGAVEVVACDSRTGDEAVLFERDGLRSVAWDCDGGVVFSTVAEVGRWRPGTGVEVMFSHQVARSFARFGTDDLYVTLDQVAPAATAADGATAALVLRWNQQGRPAREEVWTLRDGTIRRAMAGAGTSPRWGPGNVLAVAAGDRIRPADGGGRPLAAIDGLHSFDWLP